MRATLESITFQTHYLTEAMFEDRGIAAGATKTAALRVDGGMAQNVRFVQFLADALDTPVEVPPSHETTALGAAALAGIGCGLFTDAADFGARWRSAQRRTPTMPASRHTALFANWRAVIERALV